MIDGAVGLDRALRENFRFPLQLALLVQNFKGTEKVVRAVRRKCQPVCPVVDESESLRKAVIQPVQFIL